MTLLYVLLIKGFRSLDKEYMGQLGQLQGLKALLKSTRKTSYPLMKAAAFTLASEKILTTEANLT